MHRFRSLQIVHCVLTLGIFIQSSLTLVGQVVERVPWTQSRFVGSPDPPSKYTTEPLFASLKFDRPVELTSLPGTNRMVMLEANSGKLYSFENRPEVPSLEKDLFGDLASRNPQLTFVYGLAFHPNFRENRECFLSYVLKDQSPDGTRVSRFRVLESSPPRLDLDSEEILITWLGGGHNGAHLQFGSDGFLYISTGDGGSSFPPDGRNTGQDLSDLLASVLRIDVDHRENGLPYRIPDDNPFVDVPNARPEIFAYGFRNPFKICFDPADSSLWVADVGWEMWEMIYRVVRGGNYGWSIMEGEQPVHQERTMGPTPILAPTTAHNHIESRSITGGYFYGSDRLPELRGAYIYGDYVTGKIWALRHQQGKVIERIELVDTPMQISTFGIDPSGDVWIVDYPTGTIHRLVRRESRSVEQSFPIRLSESGLFTDTAQHRVAPGVIPYSVNSELWGDGTKAERLVAIPGNQKLGVYEKSNVQIGFVAGDWKFPDGSVLAKTISIELVKGDPSSRKRLETQILHFDVDTWKAYNYLWNEDQSDAVLADDLRTEQQLSIADPKAGTSVRQTWRHGSRTDCLLCHTTRVGTIQGFRIPQLGSEDSEENRSLERLDRLGLFERAIPAKATYWPNPFLSKKSLEDRARSYLQVQCGHCHSRGGGGSASFELPYAIPLQKTRLLGTRPTQGAFDIHDAQIVAAGDPYRSVLYYRLSKLGHGRMPQIGSETIDDRGVELIHDWIESIHHESRDRQPPTVTTARSIQRNGLQSLAQPFDSHSEANLQQLLKSPSGALMLVDAIRRGRLSDANQKLAIERGTVHPDPNIQSLFERFVPEEKRRPRLGGSIDVQELLSRDGSIERGRELLLRTRGVQCIQCHRIGNEGNVFGPDLSKIGSTRSKKELLESLLEPSKKIEPTYVTQLIETKDGEVFAGLLIKSDEDRRTLRLADRREVSIPLEEIERLVPQQKSLMPDRLLSELSLEQVRDLLEYLSSLR